MNKTEQLDQFFKSRTKAMELYDTKDLRFSIQWFPMIRATDTIKLRIKTIENKKHSLNRRLVREIHNLKQIGPSNDLNVLFDLELDTNKKIDDLKELSSKLDNLSMEVDQRMKKLQEEEVKYREKINGFSKMCHDVKEKQTIEGVWKRSYENCHNYASMLIDDDIITLDGTPLSARDCVQVSTMIVCCFENVKYHEIGYKLINSFKDSLGVAYHRTLSSIFSDYMKAKLS